MAIFEENIINTYLKEFVSIIIKLKSFTHICIKLSKHKYSVTFTILNFYLPLKIWLYVMY